MNGAERAQARARGYELLSRLLLDGPSVVPPALLATIVDPVPPSEELEVGFVQAFDLGVPPYASAFLEADGRVGGDATRRAMAAIEGAELDVAACHLGVLLRHLARLNAQGRSGAAAAFGRELLLHWLPALVVSVDALELPFWSAVLRTSLDLVADQVREASLPPPGFDHDIADPLQDERAGLREIAEFLASPARSGLFVTEAEAAMIGRALELPRGFGSRRQRIETLLRSAAEYDAFVPLCRALDEIADQRHRGLTSLAEGRFDQAFIIPWHLKLDVTRRVLATLAEGALSVRNPEPTGVTA